MADLFHINTDVDFAADTHVTCLCGYSYPLGPPHESIHAVWLNDDGVPQCTSPHNDKPPTCKSCLERYPLYMLAGTELE